MLSVKYVKDGWQLRKKNKTKFDKYIEKFPYCMTWTEKYPIVFILCTYHSVWILWERKKVEANEHIIHHPAICHETYYFFLSMRLISLIR